VLDIQPTHTRNDFTARSRLPIFCQLSLGQCAAEQGKASDTACSEELVLPPESIRRQDDGGQLSSGAGGVHQLGVFQQSAAVIPSAHTDPQSDTHVQEFISTGARSVELARSGCERASRSCALFLAAQREFEVQNKAMVAINDYLLYQAGDEDGGRTLKRTDKQLGQSIDFVVNLVA
jgi:hypothetical protein